MTQNDVEAWIVVLGVGLLIAFLLIAFLFVRVAQALARLNELQKHVVPIHTQAGMQPLPPTSAI